MEWKKKVSAEADSTAVNLQRRQSFHECKLLIHETLTDTEYNANNTLLHSDLTNALVAMRQADPTIPPRTNNQVLKTVVERVATAMANSTDGKASFEHMKPYDVYPILRFYMEDELEKLAAKGELHGKHQAEIEARAAILTAALAAGSEDRSRTYLSKLELQARDLSAAPATESGMMSKFRQKASVAKEAVTSKEKAELSPKTAQRLVEAAIRQIVKDSSQELGYPQKLMDRKKEHFVKWEQLKRISADPKQLHAMLEPYVDKELSRIKLVLVDKDPLGKPEESHTQRLLYTGPIGHDGIT